MKPNYTMMQSDPMKPYNNARLLEILSEYESEVYYFARRIDGGT